VGTIVSLIIFFRGPQNDTRCHKNSVAGEATTSGLNYLLAAAGLIQPPRSLMWASDAVGTFLPIHISRLNYSYSAVNNVRRRYDNIFRGSCQFLLFYKNYLF
jgi:hypothetical protein